MGEMRPFPRDYATRRVQDNRWTCADYAMTVLVWLILVLSVALALAGLTESR